MSDEGGGIKRSNMNRIWSYLYTTADPAILDKMLGERRVEKRREDMIRKEKRKVEKRGDKILNIRSLSLLLITDDFYGIISNFLIFLSSNY